MSVNNPIPPFNVGKCKMQTSVLDESVLSTLQWGGEGQNGHKMNSSNPCDQGCSQKHTGHVTLYDAKHNRARTGLATVTHELCTTVPGLLPVAFLCYIFHITLPSDLYSNIEMYCFNFTRLLYSVLNLIKMYTA